MTGNDAASKVALPGAPDLDFDVRGLTVSAVVVADREILLRLVGGHGWHVDSSTGEMAHFLEDAPDRQVIEVDVGMRLPVMPDKMFADYVAQLQRWRDEGTPVRMCGAPGKDSLLIENRDRYVLMPRRLEEQR